jgi:hypothetical protein
MDKKVVFNLFKNIIIEQNKEFLKNIAKNLNINEEELLQTYLKPEYYLPVIEKPCKETSS